MLKNMFLVVILGCIGLVNTAPAAFPVDDLSEYPDDQVEVIGGPIRSEGEGDGFYPQGGDGILRVFLVRNRPTFRISGLPNIFGGQNGGFNPFGFSSGGEEDAERIPFGGNDGFNPFSILRGGEEDAETIPFGGKGGFNPFGVLGGGEEDAEIIPVGEEGGCNNCGGGGINPFHRNDEDDCGPLCLIFKLLNGLQVEIDDINNRNNDNQNDVDAVDAVEEDGEYDINNSTYKETVLPDGSILRTNRTTIADTDENGNTFIFKSTVIHNIDSGEDTTDVEAGEDNTDDDIDTSVTADYPTEEIDDSGDDLPEVLHKSPEFDSIPDPSENEIDLTGNEGYDGIDDGLLIKDKSG